MPKCKNDTKKFYKGNEPSPKGFGWCAHAESISKKRKGKDGNMWIIKQIKNGSKRWVKISSNKSITKKFKTKKKVIKSKLSLNNLLLNPFVKNTIVPIIKEYDWNSWKNNVKKGDKIELEYWDNYLFNVISYKYVNEKIHLKCSFKPNDYNLKHKKIKYNSITKGSITEKFYPIIIKNNNEAILILNIDLNDKQKNDFHITVRERPSFNKLYEKIQNQKVKKYLESGVIFTKMSIGLVNKLESEIEKFAKKSRKDYHPFSNSKVRDLVHPSLFSYINGVSNLKNNLDITGGKHKEYYKSKKEIKVDYWNRPYEKSKYQWLPSEFNIDEKGKCKIESYINNLPEDNIELYALIEKLFEKVLPYFEKIWNYIHISKLYNSSEIFLYDGNTKSCLDTKLTDISLKNRILQVIPKIVTYELKDEKIEGAWHVEGMSHENIVATAVTVIEQTSNFDAELYFKRRFTICEGIEIAKNSCQVRPYYINNYLGDRGYSKIKYFEDNGYTEMQKTKIISGSQINGLIPLGKVSTKKYSLTVFPNSHIHKLDTANKTKKVGKRTIVVFWLVNPDVRIISTKHVNPQQKKIKLSNAKKHRIKLMEERKYHKQTFNVRDLNLCEH